MSKKLIRNVIIFSFLIGFLIWWFLPDLIGIGRETMIRDSFQGSENSIKKVFTVQDRSIYLLTHDSGLKLEVEIVNSPQTQAQGLSERDEIGHDGMLFVYLKSVRPIFWMKDMRFPIDIVWIAPDGEVVGITASIPPPDSGASLDSLPRYVAPSVVQFVLELPSGAASKYGIKTGSYFLLE